MLNLRLNQAQRTRMRQSSRFRKFSRKERVTLSAFLPTAHERSDAVSPPCDIQTDSSTVLHPIPTPKHCLSWKYSMTRTEKIAFTIILAVSIAAYGMSRLVSSDAIGSHWIAREDGVLEWLTVLSLGPARFFTGIAAGIFEDMQPRLSRPARPSMGAYFSLGWGKKSVGSNESLTSKHMGFLRRPMHLWSFSFF